MSSEPIISVSGLRGVIGQSLTPPLAMRYVAAFASTAPPGPIVISRDGREIKAFSSMTGPTDRSFVQEIERMLQQP